MGDGKRGGEGERSDGEKGEREREGRRGRGVGKEFSQMYRWLDRRSITISKREIGGEVEEGEGEV